MEKLKKITRTQKFYKSLDCRQNKMISVNTPRIEEVQEILTPQDGKINNKKDFARLIRDSVQNIETDRNINITE